MTTYNFIFDGLGLRNWCGEPERSGPMTMAELMARGSAPAEPGSGFDWSAIWSLPFPSLDELHKACAAIPRSRDLTKSLETGFLNIRESLKYVLDPLTQPLSWALETALFVAVNTPWWLMLLVLLTVVWVAGRSVALVTLVAAVMGFLLFVDHYVFAMQTLAIIFVCAFLCVVMGVPVGIAMSRSNRLQRLMIPVLDMLQTLPTFVYLIPLIFLFSVTEPKLYGIAIILYAIVPVIRLTDLGIRLVDKDVIEAAEAFGMTRHQKLIRVQIPLALPNIMAGVNQTIMMSLAMVVIASLVSAPGLGVLVLRGIRNLELGVGLMAGLGIVLLAVILDRVTKAALARVNAAASVPRH
ncbi:ABC transporter permease [Roseinatronobacter bogoriensis]|uniref:Glycine/betaine ABC transporter permease n=1 Tax=Roseinatronobacter bogoriensis subsp. barguzinensis TaxID=441209 RepID=A0A2K8KD64_9RHOB|nr:MULTISPECIES: ABC transporter permease subunit [Rhodobaca]ATX65645.1 glycine/betaine ABC transporter permease [Rhodobaca barguzinensis]MBB4208417.1 glycine betaine/proline transport system permease protein [Rhodobaca bogoriensis DSM 18756]TDW39059.1 glycine betaine/proline transport system permease protein [Rhodobaca barguzinensis]TDY68759.1 glycine betaine/proline transport system permease protein [Rhodobaca bogoriensis DSM 18756]